MKIDTGTLGCKIIVAIKKINKQKRVNNILHRKISRNSLLSPRKIAKNGSR